MNGARVPTIVPMAWQDGEAIIVLCPDCGGQIVILKSVRRRDGKPQIVQCGDCRQVYSFQLVVHLEPIEPK